MLPRHPRDLHTGRLLAPPPPQPTPPHHIHNHTLEEIQRIHVRKGLARFFLLRQVRARVRGRDDGQVAAQRGFDVLVEVVGVVVREEDGVDVREVVEVEGRVREAGAGYAGPEVDVVAGVEEVGLRLRGGG